MSPNDTRLLSVERMSRTMNTARSRRYGALSLAAFGVACACVGLISFELPTDIVSETGIQLHQLKTLSIIQVTFLTLTWDE
ncbi:MAG: hypothetical protein AAGA09_06240 [Pseudomonadota bacterium]